MNKTIKIRQTSLNQFLISPIPAIFSKTVETVYVNHAYVTAEGIRLSFETKDHKIGGCLLNELEFYKVDVDKVQELIDKAK